MLQFCLGFYVAETIQTAALCWIALKDQKPDWNEAQRAAASLAMGLFWWALMPWLMRGTYRRIFKGH